LRILDLLPWQQGILARLVILAIFFGDPLAIFQVCFEDRLEIAP
jgi:hypothetical protein